MCHTLRHLWILLVLLTLGACQPSEHGLQPVEEPVVLVSSPDHGGGSALAVFVEADADGRPMRLVPETLSADGTTTDALPGPLREEHFVVGKVPTPVADYLLVIDDSHSMRGILKRFREGMSHLHERGVFPRRARAAVLNTTPADPDHPQRVHPAGNQRRHAQHMPGFQQLVSRRSLLQTRSRMPRELAERFVGVGCKAWFVPVAVNHLGEDCMTVHTQIGLVHSLAEAGLVALSQWMEARQADGEAQFRHGAAVNVVFISDTHDPGLPRARLESPAGQALLALQPTLDDLQALLNVPVASFRVHAIAPKSDCGEPWTEASYHRVAEESGGVTADVCSLTDYRPVIREIARTGAQGQDPVVRLGYDPHTILDVRLNGVPVDWWGEGRALGLTDDEDSAGELVVRYFTGAEVAHP